MFNDIFKNQTVLVTGHTGFQGSWTILWLKQLGANVVGYSLPAPTTPSMFCDLNLEDEITHIVNDIKDFSNLQESINKYKPDFVFHLAAQPIVRTSYDKPVETFQTNIMGTVNLLESIRNVSSVKAAIVMTSDKCYQIREGVNAYRENDSMGGYDPYSASKGATELVTQSYRNSFFMQSKNKNSSIPIATIRAGNVIGGGDWAKYRIVSDCMRSLYANKPIILRNPDAVRPWQHVLEVISGMLWLAASLTKKSKLEGAWNFGPILSNKKITVRDIASKIISEWGSGNFICKKPNNDFYETNILQLDSSKAISQLEWKPVYTLDKAISETVSWYKNYKNNPTEIKNFTISQILNYSKKAKLLNIPWANGL